MTGTYKNLSFATLAMTTTTMLLLIFGGNIIIIIHNASATSSEIRMLADLNPPTNVEAVGIAADGRADYRERGNSMRLNVEIEDVPSNSTFTIEISGNIVGTITTNSFGTAELELNTNDGQVVPKILRGDLVEIFQGTELVLSGAFGSDDDDDDGNIGDDDGNNQVPITSAQNSSIQAGNNSSGGTITTVITIPQDADDLGATGAYSPNPASVSGGSTITWNNIDDSPHTATADDGSFDTGIINGGSSGSALISVSTGTSTIPYHCNVHPEMRGTLQVISSSLSTVSSSNTTLQDDALVTVTTSSSNKTTIQDLQQQIIALQQTVDSLQQTLMALQQSGLQEGNVTMFSGNNNNTATSPIQEERQQQPAPQQLQSQEQQGQQQNNRVSIVLGASSGLSNNAFEPNPVQASIGDTVTWTNDDSQPHTVTSGINGQPDGRFDSSPDFNPLLAPGQTFEHTFTEAGEYPYFCLLHPNMVGTVSVSS
jgi:plastocyanin